MKGKIFAPYLKSGAAKKKQLSQQEQLRLYAKSVETKPVDIEKVEKLKEVTERLKEAAQRGDTKTIKDTLLNIAKQISKLKGSERAVAIENFKAYIRGLQVEGVFDSFATTPAKERLTLQIFSDYIPELKGVEYFVAGGKLIQEPPKQEIKFQELFKQPTIQKPETKPRQLDVVIPRQIQTPKQTQQQFNKLIQKSKQEVAQAVAQSSKLVQNYMQQTKQLEKQLLKQPQVLKYPSVFRTPTYKQPTYKFPKLPPLIPPILPFDRDLGIPRYKKPKKKTKPFTPKYTPSLIAAAFPTKRKKVTMKQLQQLNKRVWSGAEYRPTLEIIPDKDTKQIKKQLKQVDFDSFGLGGVQF